ncbi:10692_t:CDS:2 [Diversispora eburnea]|uniref:10692_t:CDS:1 n=1 Tax=Diversispora eburnea TaxID=1213867 RepID=A0A9N9AI81_9GLOM|nr:10692_t:CDS:2 [Diversispora eburnea]
MQYKKTSKFAFAFLVILSLVIVGLVDATPVPAETNESDLISFPAENMKRGNTCHECDVNDKPCCGSLFVAILFEAGAFVYINLLKVLVIIVVKLTTVVKLDAVTCLLDGVAIKILECVLVNMKLCILADVTLIGYLNALAGIITVNAGDSKFLLPSQDISV